MFTSHRFLLHIACALLAISTEGLAQRLVKDIRTVPKGTFHSSRPRDLVRVGNRFFFTADEEQNSGRELWLSDGTPAGTQLVADLDTTTLSSVGPKSLTAVGDSLFFIGRCPDFGEQLWVSDGTNAGTRIVADLYPFGTAFSFGASVVVDGELWFTANVSSVVDLWRTDGTAAGTVKFATGVPGFGFPVAWGGRVFYTGRTSAEGSELWVTDGTQAGTFMVADLNPGAASGNPIDFTVVGNWLYFSATDDQSYEVWRTDGTAANTAPISQYGGSRITNQPRGLFAWKGEVYYFVPMFGLRGIHKTDGTLAGTTQVAAVLEFGTPVELNGELYFGNTRSLWKTDGTDQGTVEVLNVGARPTDLLRVANEIYFGVDNDLWRTDGTAGGTFPVSGLSRGDAVALADKLYVGSGELYEVAAGTGSLVKDIAFEVPGSDLQFFASLDGVLMFTADDGAAGTELWRSDGTNAGTYMLKDITPGPLRGTGVVYGDWQGEMLFSSSQDPELWKTDGTAAGTQLVADITPGPAGSDPGWFTRFGGATFFSAKHPSYGDELWITDGTSQGTRLFADLWPGTRSGDPIELTVAGDSMFFVADSQDFGEELWVTDGTLQGTRMVRDIYPGVWDSDPRNITVFGDIVLFSARDPQYGVELWRSDGTPAGTYLVSDIRAGTGPSSPQGLFPRRFVVLEDRGVFFSAYEPQVGTELWVSDGTTAGTRMVAEVAPGADGRVSLLGAAGGVVYFSGYAPSSGEELWRSDGTAAGTWPVKQIRPGGFSSRPQHLTALGLGTSLVFSANDGVHGVELWTSDGTSSGTYMLSDMHPGVRGSYPLYFMVAGDDLYYTAFDMQVGWELRAASLAVLGASSVERRGVGCDLGLGATPRVGARGVPRVGSPGFTLTMDVASASLHPMLFLSETAVVGPFPGACSLIVAPPLVMVPGRSVEGEYRARVPIPESTALLGTSFHVQGAVFGVGAGESPLALSDSIRVLVGR